MVAKDVETASNLPMFLILLPFLSSGFVPTDSMPDGLSWFAQNQPFTPIIETVRGLLLGTPIGNSGRSPSAGASGSRSSGISGRAGSTSADRQARRPGRSGRSARARTRDGPERAARLGEVDAIVPGPEPEGHLVALIPALAMMADPGPIRGRATSPQVEVRPADRLEHRQEEARVVGVVLQPVDPQRLVVADDVGHVLGQDPALTRRDDQLAVGDMADAFEDRPFARLRTDPQPLPGLRDELPERRGRSRAWTTAGSSSPSSASSEAR